MSAASAPLGTTGPVLGVAHPLYVQYRPIWLKCLDVFEGAGGFLSADKPYLIAHPREFLDHSTPVFDEDGTTIKGYTANLTPSQPSPKLLERRKLARYENYAETLIEQVGNTLFREMPSYTFEETSPAPKGKKRPIELFWEDADGMGTPWFDLLAQYWTASAVFGHTVIYFEPSADETRTVPVARAYSPLDVPDWLMNDHGQLTQIKLLEAAPRESFSARPTGDNVRVRVITDKGWSLQKANGKAIEADEHGFDRLPVIVLYAKRRALTPFIGKSVMGDPMKFIDLYNMVSEERELLRKQTFSILNVPVGEGSIDQEQALIGRQSGTGNILFTSQAASYISADGENVTVYHDSMDRLIRSIFRSALLPWDTDSKDAEAADSRRIKREDLNAQLSKFANELQRVDLFATDLVYQAAYGQRWEYWREKDGLAIAWPDEFQTTPLEELIKQFTDALHADLGETATRELKKRMVRAALPNTPKSKLQDMDEEIETMPVVTEEDRRQDELQASVKRLSAVGHG